MSIIGITQAVMTSLITIGKMIQQHLPQQQV